MAYLSMFLGLAFGFHLCIAQLKLVEPLQDVTVTEGATAKFFCTITGISVGQSIIWFVHNQTATGNGYCDIESSPSRTISDGDLVCSKKEAFKRFEGISVEHHVDSGIERNILIIPSVQKNDHDFRFQCFYHVASNNSSEQTRTALSSKWVTITVQPAAPKVESTVQTSTVVLTNYSVSSEATDSPAAIAGSISAVLIVTIIIIVAIIFYMKRKNECTWISRKQNKSGGNTISPSEPTKSEGTVNNGFLNKLNKDIKIPSTTNTQNGIPTYASSDCHRHTTSPVPIYAMPDKRKSSSVQLLSSNTETEDSSNHEIPTYALPNKRKTMVTDDNQIPVYAKPDKKLNNHNEKHFQDENLGIYYSQVPVDNGPSDNTDLAYSVVNVENQADIIEPRNSEGLAYADVSFSDPENSAKVPSNSSKSACTYSTVNY